MKKFTDIFPQGLIVSCQAREDEHLHGSDIMARLAKSAETGGATGIRANSPEDIAAIKKSVSLPVIGINKFKTENFGLFITPTFESAKVLVEAGADVVAIDATNRPRPGGEKLEDLIPRIREELGVPVMADCSTWEEGNHAADLGADVIASTLAGYTSYTVKTDGPDFKILEKMIQLKKAPVIGEGRFYYPEQAVRALEMGAWAVVIGSAITRPQQITARFAEQMNRFI